MKAEAEKMIPVRFATFNECGELGTIPESRIFELYTKLRDDATPCSICREVTFSMLAHKNPGDNEQVFGINGTLRGKRPFCIPKKDWKPDENGKYPQYSCIKTVKERKCPDPFMHIVMELLTEKSK